MRPSSRRPGLLTGATAPTLQMRAAKAIPLENIVLETDAAPQPFKKYRSNWTEPRHAQAVAQQLAELKGISVEEVADVTTRNLAGLLSMEDRFGLDSGHHLSGPHAPGLR